MAFRRRPFRPGRLRPGRTLRQPAVPPMIRRALAHAHQALVAGRPDEAARIYTRLADEAYARGRDRAGLQMDLETVRALLAAGDFGGAADQGLRALERLLAEGRLPARTRPVVVRIEQAMIDQGAQEAAQDFRRRVEELLTAHGHTWDSIPDLPQRSGAASGSTDRGRLPAQCPTCYAPLRTDEVDWVEADRAQCTYCGSIVLAESPAR